EKLGLASNLQRVPDFRIQRALLDMQFKRAQDLAKTHEESALSAILEREYQLFTDSVNRWKQLQSARYERHRGQLEDVIGERYQQLQERWEQAALRSQFRELEFSLRVQRKRLQTLVQQWQLQPMAG
ncbi:MAG: acyl-CoA desaturase, partial [Congregibacter sp.]|nr:acyl-CoA desaturase [Congregibacter sp.]